MTCSPSTAQLERLDIACGCLGWRLESSGAKDGAVRVMRLGELFRMTVTRAAAGTGGSAVLELVAPLEAPRVAGGWRALAMALVGDANAAGACCSLLVKSDNDQRRSMGNSSCNSPSVCADG